MVARNCGLPGHKLHTEHDQWLRPQHILASSCHSCRDVINETLRLPSQCPYACQSTGCDSESRKSSQPPVARGFEYLTASWVTGATIHLPGCHHKWGSSLQKANGRWRQCRTRDVYRSLTAAAKSFCQRKTLEDQNSACFQCSEKIECLPGGLHSKRPFYV